MTWTRGLLCLWLGASAIWLVWVPLCPPLPYQARSAIVIDAVSPPLVVLALALLFRWVTHAFDR